MSDEGELFVYGLIGLVVGVGLFIQGFRWLNIKRMIQNMPTSKIRSLAMGLAELKGAVLPIKGQLLKSPFKGESCVWYRYIIQEHRKSGKSSHWVTISSGTEGSYFELEDKTGKVLVAPEGAKIDLPMSYEHYSGVSKDAPASIVKFCESKGIKTKGWLFNRPLRYREYIIRPEQSLYILGTAGDNPFVDDSTGQKNVDDIMIQKGKNEKLYYISSKHEDDLLKSFRWKVIGGLFGGGALTVGCLALLLFLLGLF